MAYFEARGLEYYGADQTASTERMLVYLTYRRRFAVDGDAPIGRAKAYEGLQRDLEARTAATGLTPTSRPLNAEGSFGADPSGAFEQRIGDEQLTRVRATARAADAGTTPAPVVAWQWMLYDVDVMPATYRHAGGFGLGEKGVALIEDLQAEADKNVHDDAAPYASGGLGWFGAVDEAIVLQLASVGRRPATAVRIRRTHENERVEYRDGSGAYGSPVGRGDGTRAV